jgi:hypothetical protein
MGQMMRGAPDGEARAQQEQQQPRKKKRFGIGDILGGAIPIPH